jgi:exonuclease SbcD
MIRILHTADLHLGAPFPALGERNALRQADFLQTFERILTLAIKNEVQMLLVAGDLFDSPHPKVETVARVESGLRRLVERGITPVLLPGTHDALVVPDAVFRRVAFPGAVLLDAPTVKEPVLLHIQGQKVFLYGFSYQSFASENALASLQRRTSEGIHIGLLHGSRQGSPEWEHRKKDLSFSLPQLKEWGLDYVALGHYHGFEVLGAEQRPLACYPGSPEGKRFGENGPRYCALVTLEGDTTRVEKLQVNRRTLEERALDLSGCESQDAAIDAIRALGNADWLLRLTLGGIVEAPLDLKTLQARCADAFFHLELRDQTRLFDSDFAHRIGAEETVRGVFVRRTQDLLGKATEDQRQVIEEAFREVLVRFHAFGDAE